MITLTVNLQQEILCSGVRKPKAIHCEVFSKIFAKYVEIVHFLLLNCRFEK